jgi:membrane protease subunit (stomatin/prohibitin family)
MSFWKNLSGEFIDIIEWTDASSDTLVHRFQRHGNEIKNGAQLTVREGQTAVFVNEGQLADVFEPGRYELTTANLPILSTLKGWKYGFESPFKAEVYFVSTRRFTDQKWGTKNPVMLRDPEFGAVRLRAFGTYAYRVSDAAQFLREIVGTDGHFSTSEISHQLRNMIVARFTDALAESELAALDLAANYDELGAFVRDKIAPEFDTYGIDLTKLLVENISLPPEVEKALDKRTSMGVIGDLGAYTQFQAAQAMEKAADNPDGGAASGMGMGMGFAMANQMGNAMAQQQSSADDASESEDGPSTPPPPPSSIAVHIAVDGAATGPFGREALEDRIQSGALDRSTMVWMQGMKEWQPAGEVEALQPLFDSTPPPPPPPAS